MKIASCLRLGSILCTLALFWGGTACQKTSSEDTETLEGPEDIESAYLALAADVEKEVLGTQVSTMADMRRELMAKADKDGDGKLSEQEKADLRAQWKAMKEQMKAELKAALDTDKDGTISRDEKKAGLEAMGQKIKAAIQAILEEMRAAQEAAREKIKAACAQDKKPAAALLKPDKAAANDAGPADDLDTEALNQKIDKDLNECQAVVQEEKEKLRAALKDAIAKKQAEMDELKGKLEAVTEAKDAAPVE